MPTELEAAFGDIQAIITGHNELADQQHELAAQQQPQIHAALADVNSIFDSQNKLHEEQKKRHAWAKEDYQRAWETPNKESNLTNAERLQAAIEDFDARERKLSTWAPQNLVRHIYGAAPGFAEVQDFTEHLAYQRGIRRLSTDDYPGKKGEANKRMDLAKVASAMVRAEQAGDKGRIDEILNVMKGVTRLGGELLVTRGAQRVGKYFGAKALRALAPQVIKKGGTAVWSGFKALGPSTARRFIRKGVTEISGLGMLVVANPQMTAVEMLQYIKQDNIDLTPDEAGRLQIELTETGDPFWQAAAKGTLGTTIELASELSGAKLMLAGKFLTAPVRKVWNKIPKPKRIVALKAALLRSWLRGQNNTAAGALRKIKKGTFWNGLIGEVAEEHVAELGRTGTAAVPGLDISQPGGVMDSLMKGEFGKALSDEINLLIGMGIFPAAGVGVKAVTRIPELGRLEDLADKYQEEGRARFGSGPPPRGFTTPAKPEVAALKIEELTPDTAREFAQRYPKGVKLESGLAEQIGFSNPQLARRIVESNGSRGAFEKFGLPAGENRGDRKAFQGKIAKALQGKIAKALRKEQAGDIGERLPAIQEPPPEAIETPGQPVQPQQQLDDTWRPLEPGVELPDAEGVEVMQPPEGSDGPAYVRYQPYAEERFQSAEELMQLPLPKLKTMASRYGLKVAKLKTRHAVVKRLVQAQYERLQQHPQPPGPRPARRAAEQVEPPPVQVEAPPREKIDSLLDEVADGITSRNASYKKGGSLGRKELTPDQKDTLVSDLNSLYGQLFGHKLKRAEPTTPTQKEADRWMRSRGVRPIFVTSDIDEEGGFTGLRMTDSNLVVIRLRPDENAFWATVAHEVVHATDIDKSTAFNDELVDEYAQKYYNATNPEYRERLDREPDLLRREGIASLISDFASKPEFRKQMLRDKPTLWRNIRDMILKVIGKFDPKTAAERTMLNELRASVKEEQKNLRQTPPQSIIAATLPLDEIFKGGKSRVQAGRSLAKRLLTSAGHLPDAVFERKLSRDGMIGSLLSQMKFTLRDFDRAAKAVYGGRENITPEDVARLDAALKGRVELDELPEPMRPVVQQMREQIDALSRRLIDIGAVEGELEITIDENMGVYATRSYRVFDDPKWAEKVDVEIRNKAKALLRSEYPDKSEDQIEGYIQNLLYADKAAENPIAFLAKSKLGSKDLSITKRRKNIPPEIRALWGEYKDARVNYAKSVAKMANLIENHRFLTDVRDAGMGQFFFDEPMPGFQVLLVDKVWDNKVMAPLNGKYTSPEIKQAFEREYSQENLPEWLRVYMMANGAVKFSKTVGSAQTHVRNFGSNTGFSVAQGHWRIWYAGKAIQAMGEEAFRETMSKLPGIDIRSPAANKRWRDYYRYLQELGVVHTSVRSGELRAAIRDASKRNPDEYLDDAIKKSANRIMRGAHAVGRGLGTLYQIGDDIWKIYAFENEKARYRRALPQLSESQLDLKAARVVSNTFPNWSKVPEGVQKLRRFPLTGPFVSFPAEVFRVGWHSLKLIDTELKDPQLRGIGAQRLAGLTLAIGGTAAASAASRFLSGVSKDDDDDLREFVAPWNENSEIIHFGRTEDGKFRWIDLSYTDPYQYLKKPVMALMRGDDWEDSLWSSFMQIFEPFIGEEILAQKLGEAWANKKVDSGGAVFNPQESLPKRAEQVAGHVWGALEPGTITSARRISRGVSGKTNKYGQSYSAPVETAAVVFGQRIQTTDIRQSLGFRASRFNRDYRDASQIFTSVAARRGSVTSEELTDAYQSAEASRRRLFDQMRQAVQAAQRLGVQQRGVFQILRGRKVPQKLARQLLADQYQPYRPSPQLLKSIHVANPQESQQRLEIISGILERNLRQRPAD
jgi:hypothetical protein